VDNGLCDTWDTSSCVDSICGDDLITGGEVCDNNNFGEETCASIRGAGWTGSLSCINDCNDIDGSACIEPIVVFRTNIDTCTSSAWGGSSSGQWFTLDEDDTLGNDLIGYGRASSTAGTKTPSLSFVTAPCDYGLNKYSGTPALRIYVIDVGGTTTDRGFYMSSYTQTNPSYLSEIPCCGITCGTCCERYSDGSTNC
jgi:hypothetical protein